jgi:riboflavin transporter FmnP
MQSILFEYEINPVTWAYLSALLIVGIYFRFHRLWSIRNADLIGLLCFSPGLIFIFHGLNKQFDAAVDLGFVWLFVVGGLFAIRLFFDAIMVRRPLLEPNLNASGLTFTALALLAFLGANVLTASPALRLEFVLAKQNVSAMQSPGCPYLYYLASYVNTWPSSPEETAAVAEPKTKGHWTYPPLAAQIVAARTIVLISHIAVLLGMLLIGFRHFDNLQTGIAAVALYLLLPYTSQMTGRIDHALPGALLVWALAAYRRPVIAGAIIGVAAGFIFYPLFLLPLWISFYWRRGLGRFISGFCIALAVLAVVLLFVPSSSKTFLPNLAQMFGSTIFSHDGVFGFWDSNEMTYRIPVLAIYAVVCLSLGLWPAQKNFGTLLSCSALVMLGSQFWHAHEGGLYMAWYLPLIVLMVFRPNLEDRIAVSAVIEGRVTIIGRMFGRLVGKA